MFFIRLKWLTVGALMLVPLTSTYADTFLICKPPKTGMAGKGACINAYNPTANQVCSGSGENKVCSTQSLEDLCIKVGTKVGIPFNQFSSGLGTFESESQCLQSCNKEYGGAFVKFGGECFGTVSK
ncbi:hypothetical protein [Paraglaciecola marina]|uniref:hypothetical protein n=1 Tax=Paraglaciecola marina TaxID=2500157 RepID=UPI001060552D|nr:hypothetical protein [Paraglaciecola marina]